MGGIGWRWVGGTGYYQIIIFKDIDVVSVGMQPCLDALVFYCSRVLINFLGATTWAK